MFVYICLINRNIFSQCDHGRWLCTNRTCPRTCLVLGNMNILTFDGKRYALVSKCNQVLVEVFYRIGFKKNKNKNYFLRLMIDQIIYVLLIQMKEMN